MGPVITLMMGRLKDWLRVQTERDGAHRSPTRPPCRGPGWPSSSGPPAAGSAARGLRARPLGAAIRAPAALVGADRRRQRHHDARVVAASLQCLIGRGPAPDGRAGRTRRSLRSSTHRFPDFVRAYEPDGLSTSGVRRVRPTPGDPASSHRPRITTCCTRWSDALVPNPDLQARAVTDLFTGRRGLPSPQEGWSVVLTPGPTGWRFSGLRAADPAEPAARSAFAHRFGRGDRRAPSQGAYKRSRSTGQRYSLEPAATERLVGTERFRCAPPGCGIERVEPAGRPVARSPTAREPNANSRLRYVEPRPGRGRLRGAGCVVARGAGTSPGRTNSTTAAPSRSRSFRRAGNWGSYPPHKHDEIPRADQTELKEIYYYVVADGPVGPGLAYQHVYGTAERPIDLLTTVGTDDTVLVPHGWHGPTMAAPGYDLTTST